jgi:hypothetical protein
MKQTAVEWLYKLSKKRELDKVDLQQAKEMEKEQIIDARIDGDTYSTAIKEIRTEYAEQYYKETYGGEK